MIHPDVARAVGSVPTATANGLIEDSTDEIDSGRHKQDNSAG